MQARTADPVTSVYVPTTPNPTSGFLLFVPRSDIITLDMSVEEAVKMVISMGLGAEMDGVICISNADISV